VANGLKEEEVETLYKEVEVDKGGGKVENKEGEIEEEGPNNEEEVEEEDKGEEGDKDEIVEGGMGKANEEEDGSLAISNFFEIPECESFFKSKSLSFSIC
jgi:hypothetical protein